MATTQSATCTLQLEYNDGTTRNLTFDNMASMAMSTIKTRVKALNATLANQSQSAPYKETFISDDGYPIEKIKAARYVLTEEEQIFGG